MKTIQLKCFARKTVEGMDYQYLHIQVISTDGLIEPMDLKGLMLPSGMVWSLGVVIGGKAPIWLYGYLVHECHAAVWVACFDPRLGNQTANSGGAVVVATHTRQVKVGDVILVMIPPEVHK